MCDFLQHVTQDYCIFNVLSVVSRSAHDRDSTAEKKCVLRDERKPIVSSFRVLGQPMTSTVGSNTRGRANSVVTGEEAILNAMKCIK